ncbi:hypothetical protein JTE90_011328 [Oedothorax gibbosus]|uniref:Uncharacterized protein n=1 Tax=Oedothorax gibbosus TaxID=931172 RepID=A0AAV6VMM6_9ARAC|nr:hypothetical protein JTE90_011328 [Oedothorax gibbosus]
MSDKVDRKPENFNSTFSPESLIRSIDVKRKTDDIDNPSSQVYIENRNEKPAVHSNLFNQDTKGSILDNSITKEAIDSLFSKVDVRSIRQSETNVKSQQVLKTDATPTEEPARKKSAWYFICSGLKYFKIEFLLLLYGVMVTLIGTFQDNIIYNKICSEHLGGEYEKCFDIENEVNVSRYELKIYDVLKQATSHKTAVLVISLPLQFVSSMFLCSWSDTCGRTLPLIVAFLSVNFNLLNYFFRNFEYGYFATALYTTTIFSSLFGGTICINAMCYSYGTDNSSVSFRTFKFATMDVSFVSGTIAGSLILRNFPNTIGLLENFLFSVFVSLISVTWIFLAFEDQNFEGKDMTNFEKLGDLFSTSNATSVFKVLKRWRCNCEAEQLRMIVVSVMPAYIYYGVAEGPFLANSKHLSYFTNTKLYNLCMNGFHLYSCVFELLTMTFIQFCVGLEDSSIGLIGIFSLFFPSFITAFVSDLNTLLLALLLAAVKSFPSIALRSTASKISEAHEIGSMFLFVSFGEVTAMYAGRIWHQKRYFVLGPRTYPDSSFLLECTFLVIPFCFFMFKAISIQTESLFRKCYRTVQVPTRVIKALPLPDNVENFDA